MLGFERLLHEALSAGSRLSAAALMTQREQGLSPIAGHQIIAAIASANVHLSEALARSAEGHRLIERMAQGLGIDVAAYGDGRKPDEQRFFTTALASPRTPGG